MEEKMKKIEFEIIREKHNFKFKAETYKDNIVVRYLVENEAENTQSKDKMFFCKYFIVNGKNTFVFSDLKLNGEKVGGLYVNNIEIENKLDDLIKFAKAEFKKQIEKQTEIALNAEVKGYLFEIGCDCASTYQIEYAFPEELAYEAISARITKDRLLSEAIKKLDLQIEGKILKAEPLESRSFSYGGYHFNKEQTEILISKAQIIMQKMKEEAEKKRKEYEIEKLKAEKELENAFENELWIFGSEMLSRSGGLLLHSLGANISEKKISIFTVGHSRFMKDKNPSTTYSLKEKIKDLGFKWNAEDKNWEIEYTKEAEKKTIEFLQKYDTKANPADYNIVRCWECGSWGYPSEMKWDGRGYYCGC